MTIVVSETFVDETRNAQYGDSGWYEPYTDDIGKLYKSYRQEFGQPSKMFIEVNAAKAPYDLALPAKTIQVGWVFSKKTKYDDSKEYYKRSVWVSFGERNEHGDVTPISVSK